MTIILEIHTYANPTLISTRPEVIIDALLSIGMPHLPLNA
jgi:hypothetical protein